MIDDPNTIYGLAIVDSMAKDGPVSDTFTAARDNPKYPTEVLMACVLAGWFAAIGVYPPRS